MAVVPGPRVSASAVNAVQAFLRLLLLKLERRRKLFPHPIVSGMDGRPRRNVVELRKRRRFPCILKSSTG